MSTTLYITCPCCGLNRVLEKTGSSALARGITIREIKGRIRFDHIDLVNGIIVQFRERPEGPEEKRRLRRGGGPGFILRGGLTLSEMRDNADYADLVEQLRVTCRAILETLSESG